MNRSYSGMNPMRNPMANMMMPYMQSMMNTQQLVQNLVNHSGQVPFNAMNQPMSVVQRNSR